MSFGEPDFARHIQSVLADYSSLGQSWVRYVFTPENDSEVAVTLLR